MKITLRFHGNATSSVSFEAETDAEKAILAFLAENPERRWQADPSHSFRPGGVAHLDLWTPPIKTDEVKA